MSYRKKILIIEHDDFLREILGNLLHKKGNYILNGYSIENGIKEAIRKNIATVILGTSCLDYSGKNSIHHIRKELGSDTNFFIINDTSNEIDFVPKDMQMKTSELSVEKILQKFSFE